VENIDSDYGRHFISKVLKGIMESLNINLYYHTLWHPLLRKDGKNESDP
jgi:hypothetical protein